MFCRLFASLVLFCGLAAQALAEPAPACAPEGATPFALSRIAPDGTLFDGEGKAHRLAGLLWPDRLESARAERLHMVLEHALRGQTLTFHAAGPADRWGRQPIHLFVREPQSAQPAFWLQAGMAEAGLAPAWPELDPFCWHRLRTHERLALRARRGFWAPRAQAARHRALMANPRAHAGRRMVARWRVYTIGKGTFVTYLNMAPSGRSAASVRLSGKEAADMAAQGRDPARLKGRYVLARFISGPGGLMRVRLVPGDALAPVDEQDGG